MFLASCDLIAAGLGVCGCASNVGTEIDYKLCAEQRTSVEQAAPQDRPRKWCKFYSNGTIDIPTPVFLEAYVYVGSRLCIGDRPVVEAATSIDDDLRDQLRARSGTPFASWSPGGDLEIDEDGEFEVEFAGKTVTGNLLGKSATIRFTPVAYRWIFSDGERANTSRHQKSFATAASHTAQAFVRIRVDYRFSDSPWVMGALESEIPSNQLRLNVLERPRRTLLVG